jgi:predicted PurR-regulated permease PerM
MAHRVTEITQSQSAAQRDFSEPQARQVIRLLTVIAVLMLIASCFLASSICIAIILASFAALLADPAVQYLERLRFPRYLAAALVVLAGAALASALVYGSYVKVSALSENFEVYTGRILQLIAPINARVQHVRNSTAELIHETAPKEVPELRVRETTPWATYLLRGVGSSAGALMIAGVVPFLVFFMLLVREKLYLSFKTLLGDRLDIDGFIIKTKSLVLGYVIGSVMIGAGVGALSVLVFWLLGLQPALTLGIVSGMLSLVPFVGFILALAVPLIPGLVQLHGAGPFLIIFATVLVLHLIAANLLLPRFVGSRLDIGPVAATVGLLFWGWLWGIPGILLAVPLTAVLKLFADSYPHLAHLSNLLARNPRRIFRRRVVGEPS